MRQVILDTETTGLSFKDGHRVIEIGAIEMIDRRITDNHFHNYINPEREVEAGALKVHGISNEFLQDKPLFADVAQSFSEFIDGAELIIHNAPFDVGFLDFEIKKCLPEFGKLKKHCEIFDTLVLARRMFPGQRNSLDALCRRYEIDSFDRQLHGALLDAKILAQVYLLMTGGQAALFSESMMDGADIKQEAEIISTKQRKPLPVIKANEKELALHNAYVEKLMANGGVNTWENND